MAIKELIEEGTFKLESSRSEEKTKKLKEAGGRTYLYASTDSAGCPRKTFFSFFPDQFPTEFDARTLRVFHNGDAVHERLAKYLEKTGRLVGLEINIPMNDENIHGRIDAIVKTADGLAIVDFKSINLDRVNNPKEEHVAQVLLYMDLYGIHKGYLLYESKRNQELFEFEIHYDEVKAKQIRQYMKQLLEDIKAGNCPTIPEGYGSSKYPCTYCPYAEFCWKEKRKELDSKLKEIKEIVKTRPW